MSETNEARNDPDDLAKYAPLSALQTVLTLYTDARGMHLCFFDRAALAALPEEATMDQWLPVARYIFTVDPGAALDIAGRIVRTAHVAIEAGLPIHHPEGAPSPWPPDARYVLAGAAIPPEFAGFAGKLSPNVMQDIRDILARSDSEHDGGSDAPIGESE